MNYVNLQVLLCDDSHWKYTDQLRLLYIFLMLITKQALQKLYS